MCNGNSSAGECILKLLGKRVALVLAIMMSELEHAAFGSGSFVMVV